MKLNRRTFMQLCGLTVGGGVIGAGKAAIGRTTVAANTVGHVGGRSQYTLCEVTTVGTGMTCPPVVYVCTPKEFWHEAEWLWIQWEISNEY